MHARQAKKAKPALATQARPKNRTMNHHPPIVRKFVVITKVFTTATPTKFALRCIQRLEVLLHYIAPQIQVNMVSPTPEAKKACGVFVM